MARELTDRLGLEIDEAAGRIILVEEQGAALLDLSDMTPFTDLVVVGRQPIRETRWPSACRCTARIPAPPSV